MIDFDLICIDFQRDFADENGINFNNGKSVDFIKNTLFPALIDKNLKVSEIISDYRLPRGKSKNESCVPGTNGYESLLPKELRNGEPWIKCMHNPLWTRENIGLADLEPGKPYQDHVAFDAWIDSCIKNKKIVLFGLTTECCVLQVAAELYFRGFDVYCIYEATDPMNERMKYKDEIMYHSTFTLYAKAIHFDEFLQMIGGK